MEFASKIYNSKSREIFELGQNGNLSILNLYATLSNLEIFGDEEECVLYFSISKLWKLFEKYFGNWKRF
jgi:hypothetical protein